MSSTEIKRKSLYDLSWKVSEEEYRNDPSYSYSKLSKFSKVGFDGLNTLDDKISSPSLIFGSIFDCLLTDEKSFNDRFVIGEFPIITDQLMKIAQTLWDQNKENNTSFEDFSDDYLSKVGKDCEYYSGDNYSKVRIKNIKENCKEYYELLRISGDKTLISQKDYQDALSCLTAMKESSIGKFLSPNPFEDCEVFYQLKFKAIYLNIPIRCMFDLIFVDHKNKCIYPIDIKTTFKKEWHFVTSFLEWRYDIQSRLYWGILKRNLELDPIYNDYELRDFRFAVISRYNKKPLLWKDSNCRSDKSIIHKGIEYKNWREILKELYEYQTNIHQYPLGIKEENDLMDFIID